MKKMILGVAAVLALSTSVVFAEDINQDLTIKQLSPISAKHTVVIADINQSEITTTALGAGGTNDVELMNGREVTIDQKLIGESVNTVYAEQNVTAGTLNGGVETASASATSGNGNYAEVSASADLKGRIDATSVGVQLNNKAKVNGLDND